VVDRYHNIGATHLYILGCHFYDNAGATILEMAGKRFLPL